MTYTPLALGLIIAAMAVTGVRGASIGVEPPPPVEGVWVNADTATNWTWTSDGYEITLTGYTGPANVVVPGMLDGLPVTAMTSDTFDTSVTNVSGGLHLTAVPDNAFYGATSLVSVVLPSVISIGDEAFEGCSALANVHFPNVTDIGFRAFWRCSALVDVSLPSVVTLAPGVFEGCSSLTSVSIPKATAIDDITFSGCSSLVSLEAPSATFVGDLAFNGCSAFESLYLSADVGTTGNPIFIGSGDATVYVTEPTATNWGSTFGNPMFNARPVVRLQTAQGQRFM